MTRLSIALVTALLAAASSAPSAAITGPVQLDTGLVAGVPAAGPGVQVFKGIPFAAPPVGDLRWRPPQPAAKWNGVRQADRFGNVCIQAVPGNRLNIAVVLGGPQMSEDCLYLNVWTAAEAPSERRPVMVWIYGGAFTEGGGVTDLYDGSALARKGAVVVTLNYRLGPFGFFTHPELTKESGRNASGNYGIMDVVAALRWVQRNIAGFGGDPGSVTVFGQSAGAMMIGSLVASPEAKGVFHRAIGQSGSWLGLSMGRGVMTTREATEPNGLKQAASLNVTTLAELRAKTADEVQKALRGAGMIVDGWIIPEDPSDIYAAGRQNAVDVLVGANTRELQFTAGGGGRGGRGGGAAPSAAQAWEQRVRQRWGELADAYLKFYPFGTDAEATESSNRAANEEAFWVMRLKATRQLALGQRAYMYWFTFDPPSEPGQPSLGATHAAEIPFVFDNLSAPRLFPDGSSPALTAQMPVAQRLGDVMSSYWVNFARTGDPNGPGLPAWPAYREGPQGQAMHLGERIEPQPVDATKYGLYDQMYARVRAEAR